MALALGVLFLAGLRSWWLSLSGDGGSVGLWLLTLSSTVAKAPIFDVPVLWRMAHYQAATMRSFVEDEGAFSKWATSFSRT